MRGNFPAALQAPAVAELRAVADRRAKLVMPALMMPDAKALSARYGELPMPVAIVAGNGDKIVSPDHAERLRGAVPDATLRTVEGVGHMVHHVATEQVVEAIEEVAGRSRPALADQAPDLQPAAAGRVREAA